MPPAAWWRMQRSVPSRLTRCHPPAARAAPVGSSGFRLVAGVGDLDVDALRRETDLQQAAAARMADGVGDGLADQQERRVQREGREGPPSSSAAVTRSARAARRACAAALRPCRSRCSIWRGMYRLSRSHRETPHSVTCPELRPVYACPVRSRFTRAAVRASRGLPVPALTTTDGAHPLDAGSHRRRGGAGRERGGDASPAEISGPDTPPAAVPTAWRTALGTAPPGVRLVPRGTRSGRRTTRPRPGE